VNAAGTVLAFDFGSKRIGVAVGELDIGLAHPLQIIAYEDNARRMEAIAALVEQWQPVRLVVGTPKDERNTAHALGARIDRFVRRLRARFGIPVETIDERLTSWSASRRLSQAGLPARRQKARLDAEAACEILRTWFEQQRSGASLPPEPH
jgi:putative Holliday junction resolvase